MKQLPYVFLLQTLLFNANAEALFDGKWIDLTHAFSNETIYWPTSKTFKKEAVFEGYTEKGYYYTAYNISMAEHGGTHIDAPVHFAEKRNTVDQIEVGQLVGPGVLIRITTKARENRNYQLSVEDILNWEKQHGPVPDKSILLIDTGSGGYWPDKMKYMGTDMQGEPGVASLKFPGIHPDAARYLVTNRKINAIGIDSPSLDFGGSILFETHRILSEKNIPGFENVANLDQLPTRGFWVIALPMKIAGGSGGPLRIVAFIPGEG